MNTTLNKSALKSCIEETQALMQLQEEQGEVSQDRLQDLLAELAKLVSYQDMRSTSGETFEEAIRALRDNVFIRPEGTHWAYGGGTPGVAGYAEATTLLAQKLADTFKWPPVLPTVAVAINLVRALIRAGVRFDLNIKHVADFDFAPFQAELDHAKITRRNGWMAFYVTYGELILAA